MLSPLRVSFVALLPLGVGALAAASAPLPPVSFNRDIRPIMSDTCFHCHGFDAKSRKAGMRLDIREEALKPTPKHKVLPIVPGKPDESEIITRIEDPGDPMPPEDAHKVLTPEQKALFRRWVAEGAVYEPHWAYAALTRPPVPEIVNRKSEIVNPIDAFIREKLAAKKIEPSPEAPKARLLRRLSLDLTGLPPTPAEVGAFVADTSPQAYEKQVDRLLSSVHHGERMAVWWLDIARFADTVGFHGDQNQRIFPYRDYVIDAFNRNKRFDQFTIEQLAGDLLPSPTKEQLVATGYNRLNMMTREGGAQANEYLAKYGAERVRSVAAAWFGSTFGCAECHDHKFDPIKTRDFYELKSFFADVKQWGIYADYNYTPNTDLKGYNNDYPFPPEVEVDSPYLLARARRFAADLMTQRTAFAALVAKDGTLSEKIEKWAEETKAFLTQEPTGWTQPPLTANLMKGTELIANGEVPIANGLVVRAPRALAAGESLRVVLHPGPGRVAAVRLEVADDVAPPAPAMTKGKAVSAARMRAAGTIKLTAALRTTGGKEMKKDEKLDFIFADSATKDIVYQGGSEVIGLAQGWKLPTESGPGRLSGVWLLAAPRTFAANEQLVLTITGAAPALRLYASPLADLEPTAVASAEVLAALQADPARRTAAQRETLTEAWLLSTAGDRPAFDQRQKLAARLRETRQGRAWSMITEPAAQPLTVRVLPRGNWQDETGAVVTPATPSFLPGRIESTPEKRLTRLDLAKWIVSDQNPITARTVMNRLWAMYFGTGLSAAVDDLGSQGELPSHPELLDWLASEFRSSQWDLRHMMKLIVMSRTYRQSSSLRPELRDIDPANRLLASQNPRRLEAEFVRDNALFIAGLLNLRDVGGPSVKPYQPDGYYAAIQFPDRVYIASDDDEQWRRGVYMHWQRTFLHPMLANFDAPARDECAAARVVSNTPQQALTLLNDPEFVEAARVFAARLVSGDGMDEARFTKAFQLALARDPKPAEVASLKTHLAVQRDYYRGQPTDAEKLLRTGRSAPPSGDPVELAAWTSVARVILNLQECITRY